MEEHILSELKEIRRILTHLVGTAELAPPKQLSIEALNKAAKEFQKLSRESDRWIKNYQLHHYFPGCPEGLGKFIREELEFSDFFTHAGAIYHKKASILELVRELELRNIDLAMYMELRKKRDQSKKNVKAGSIPKKKRNDKGKPFNIK